MLTGIGLTVKIVLILKAEGQCSKHGIFNSKLELDLVNGQPGRVRHVIVITCML